MEIGVFGDRLAQLRNAKGVSARDMSLSIGQSANYINKIENRKAYPSMSAFFYICDYLNITPQDFFNGKNKYPQQLNDMLQDLQKLDERSLALIAGITKEILGNR